MKNLSALLSRTALTLAAGLALGACSRSEYALLPRSASYLGAAPAAAHPAAPVAPAPAPLVAAPAPLLATPKPAPAVAAARPATTNAAPAAPEAAPAASKAAAPAKPSLAQRLALKAISKKLDKLTAQAPQFKQHDTTASTARINGNLRTGIILLVIGLLVGLLNGLIGTIIAIIGLVFILLWLLDEL